MAKTSSYKDNDLWPFGKPWLGFTMGEIPVEFWPGYLIETGYRQYLSNSYVFGVRVYAKKKIGNTEPEIPDRPIWINNGIIELQILMSVLERYQKIGYVRGKLSGSLRKQLRDAKLKPLKYDLQNKHLRKMKLIDRVHKDDRDKIARYRPKVGILVGHTYNKPGATSNIHPPEHIFNTRVALEVVRKLRAVSVFYHDTYDDGYTAMVERTAKKMKSFDYILDLHYNSSSNPESSGAEVLVYGSKASIQAGKYFLERMTEVGIRPRRIKILVKGDRGYMLMRHTIPIVLTLEPFYGSNTEDCEKIKIRNYAEVIIKTIKYLWEFM